MKERKKMEKKEKKKKMDAFACARKKNEGNKKRNIQKNKL
jgi:hypothetical protein